MTGDGMDEVLESLTLAPRTQGRAAVPVEHRYVRDLVPADLALLGAERGTKAPGLKRIRDSHHALARALASGMRPGEVAATFGYSLSRVSILQADPSFQELVALYAEERNLAYQATHERMAALAGDFVAELGERLEADPESMTHGFILDAIKTLADRTGNGPQTKNLNVNVNVDLAARLKAARERAGIGEGTGRRPTDNLVIDGEVAREP